MYYVYLIQSIKIKDQHYVGYTTDLELRIKDHNSGKSVHTSKFCPWILVCYFAFRNKRLAISFEHYLATIEAIKAHITVGTEQAKALQDADVKVIANTSNPTEGVSNVMDLFSSKGGTNLASMVEAFGQTPLGKLILGQMGITDDKKTDE